MDLALLLRLLITPATVLLACDVQRRLGPAAGGRLIALPLTTGPFLLVIGLRSGTHVAAVAAAGVVAGQLSVAAFCAAYAGLAARLRPSRALAAALAASLGCGAAAVVAHDAAVPSWVAATAVLAVTGLWLHALPRPALAPVTSRAPSAGAAPLRILASMVVVGTLVEASGILGPGLAGVLATAPVILSIIVPTTHRSEGAPHAVALTRGTLAALPASVVAIAILAQTLDRLGPLVAVALAVFGLAAIELNLGPSEVKRQIRRAVVRRLG